VIEEEGLDEDVYDLKNTVEEHFSISIAPVQSRGGSLVLDNYSFLGFIVTSLHNIV
jgi:hypothetical protein